MNDTREITYQWFFMGIIATSQLMHKHLVFSTRLIVFMLSNRWLSRVLAEAITDIKVFRVVKQFSYRPASIVW